MKYDRTHDLDIVVTFPENSPCRLAGNGEGLGKKLVKGCLSASYLFLPLCRQSLHLILGKAFGPVRVLINALDYGSEALHVFILFSATEKGSQ